MEFGHLAKMLLTVLFVAALTEGQSIFVRTPKDGDSCKTFKFSSRLSNIARILQDRLQAFPCGNGQVVDSAGNCVRPEDSDRCQDSVVFNFNYIRNRCARNPTLRFADPYNCGSYYDCTRGYNKLDCPAATLYNDITKRCDPFSEVQCGERAVEYTSDQLQLICNLYPNRIIIRSTVCNSYYNCSQIQDPLGRMLPYHGECIYLQLLDAEKKLCLPFDQVNCKNRQELKNPCDLDQFQCGRSSHCRPCYVDNPDCSSLPDGDNPFPGQPFSPKYARCFQGRSLGSGTCNPVSGTEPRLFDPRVGGCASVNTIPRSLGGNGA